LMIWVLVNQGVRRMQTVLLTAICHKEGMYSVRQMQSGQSGGQIPVELDFSHTSRPALWPTQPPVQWVLGLS
jgi:hypothetical protein